MSSLCSAYGWRNRILELKPIRLFEASEDVQPTMLYRGNLDDHNYASGF